jgi:hypothetical protein
MVDRLTRSKRTTPGRASADVGMSHLSGLPCRWACGWIVRPASGDDRAALIAAIAERDAHELQEHGQVWSVANPPLSIPSGPFNAEAVAAYRATAARAGRARWARAKRQT